MKKKGLIKSIGFFVVFMVLVTILSISVGQNADKPGNAIIVGVAFGVTLGCIPFFIVALFLHENSNTTNVTNQSIHVYGANAEETQTVATRSVTDGKKTSVQVSK